MDFPGRNCGSPDLLSDAVSFCLDISGNNTTPFDDENKSGTRGSALVSDNHGLYNASADRLSEVSESVLSTGQRLPATRTGQKSAPRFIATSDWRESNILSNVSSAQAFKPTTQGKSYADAVQSNSENEDQIDTGLSADAREQTSPLDPQTRKTAEQEAVAFFRDILKSKGSRLAIASLHGFLGHASRFVRIVCGNTLRSFSLFLARNTETFCISGDMVSLKEPFHLSPVRLTGNRANNSASPDSLLSSAHSTGTSANVSSVYGNVRSPYLATGSFGIGEVNREAFGSLPPFSRPVFAFPGIPFQQAVPQTPPIYYPSLQQQHFAHPLQHFLPLHPQIPHHGLSGVNLPPVYPVFELFGCGVQAFAPGLPPSMDFTRCVPSLQQIPRLLPLDLAPPADLAKNASFSAFHMADQNESNDDVFPIASENAVIDYLRSILIRQDGLAMGIEQFYLYVKRHGSDSVRRFFGGHLSPHYPLFYEFLRTHPQAFLIDENCLITLNATAPASHAGFSPQPSYSERPKKVLSIVNPETHEEIPIDTLLSEAKAKSSQSPTEVGSFPANINPSQETHDGGANIPLRHTARANDTPPLNNADCAFTNAKSPGENVGAVPPPNSPAGAYSRGDLFDIKENWLVNGGARSSFAFAQDPKDIHCDCNFKCLSEKLLVVYQSEKERADSLERELTLLMDG